MRPVLFRAVPVGALIKFAGDSCPPPPLYVKVSESRVERVGDGQVMRPGPTWATYVIQERS